MTEPFWGSLGHHLATRSTGLGRGRTCEPGVVKARQPKRTLRTLAVNIIAPASLSRRRITYGLGWAQCGAGGCLRVVRSDPAGWARRAGHRRDCCLDAARQCAPNRNRMPAPNRSIHSPSP